MPIATSHAKRPKKAMKRKFEVNEEGEEEKCVVHWDGVCTQNSHFLTCFKCKTSKIHATKKEIITLQALGQSLYCVAVSKNDLSIVPDSCGYKHICKLCFNKRTEPIEEEEIIYIVLDLFLDWYCNKVINPTLGGEFNDHFKLYAQYKALFDLFSMKSEDVFMRNDFEYYYEKIQKICFLIVSAQLNIAQLQRDVKL